MASSSSTMCKHDVFLNFRGIDTRDGFTSYLYQALDLAEISTFIDKKLERGEEISPALLQEIESSSIFVVIFSQNYAFSPYCLDELVKIIECKECIGRVVFPVFYKVDPTDVEELRGIYEKAFAEHETTFKVEKDKLEKWKSALQKSAKLSGWHVTDDRIAPKYIKRIVLTILKKLNEEKRETLKRKLQELQGIEVDVNSQIEKTESFLTKRLKDDVGIWLTNIRRIKNGAQSMHKELDKSRWTMLLGSRIERILEEASELIDQKDRLEEALVLDASQKNDKALPTQKMVGQEFQTNMDLILEWLSSDEISSIGIYGMGGVGKTTLVTHIYNKLLEDRSKFSHVYWVTVSQDFSVYRLQSLIAKTIKMRPDIEEEEDVRKRSARLFTELNKKHKFVLILDDLWNHFDVMQVGLPIESNRCTLIVTTRSIEVCRRTNCQRIRKVEPLKTEEAWNLFVDTYECKLSPNVEVIAEAIARECAGLPLAIVTMAGSLRGVDDLCEWKNALMEVQRSIVRQEDMGEGVFRILKYSYTRLNDPVLQQCLLYCTLFPEDYLFTRERLVEYLIVEGIIDERDTRQEKINKGYSMLNKLVYVSLLERVDGYVKMHDLIRDMAIQIMKECQPSIVEPGKQLQFLPDKKYWRKDIVRVSLVKNEINEIPSNFSPSCPNLSTLLLCNNWRLLSAAGSFFDQLQGLKVLDISHTAIEELPESIASLKNLIALFMRCSSVRYIPTLANLKSMELLDLYECSEIEKVPEGLEYLSDLRYLNLLYSGIMEFPGGILPKLCHLQFLAFNKPSKNAEELGGLWRLETLYWCFPTIGDLNAYLHLLHEMPREQIKYAICVGPGLSEDDLDDENHDDLENRESADREVILRGCTLTRELRQLHFQIDTLLLYDVSLDQGMDCPDILFSDSEIMVPRLPNSTVYFPLRVLYIDSCSVKKLIPYSLLSNLQNLETIHVHDCEELEEIISVEENSCTLPLCLSNLRQLILTSLPELKNIYSGEIKCDYLQSVFIFNCEELKNISISLPLLYLQAVEVQPRKWWESVKWGHPDQKDALPCTYADY